MEITFAYFELIKFSVIALVLFAAFRFYRAKRYKIALGISIILVLVEIFLPIHYNGAESDTYHTINQNQITAKYNDINTTPAHTDKLTFDQALQQEAEYNKLQNIKLQKELK